MKDVINHLAVESADLCGCTGPKSAIHDYVAVAEELRCLGTIGCSAMPARNATVTQESGTSRVSTYWHQFDVVNLRE
jgi:hypothetical protein